MTKLLAQAITRVQALPPAMQDEIARLVMSFAGDGSTIALTPEEEECLVESEAAAARGEFATDEQVHSIWAKHGL